MGLQSERLEKVVVSIFLFSFGPVLSLSGMVRFEFEVVGIRSLMATSFRRKGSRRPRVSRVEISAARASCSRFGQPRTRRAIMEVDSLRREGRRRFRRVSPWTVVMAEIYNSERSEIESLGDLGEEGYEEAPAPPVGLVFGVSIEWAFPALLPSAPGEVQEEDWVKTSRGVLIVSP